MMSEHGNQRDLGDSLKSLGIPTGEIRRVETISVRPGHRLYRIRSHGRSYVLKSFPVKNPGNEIRSYDLLGVGTRYSDFRNVVGSLSGEAVTGFREVYGRVDPGEQTLDRPLATLYALVSAARMATFPTWAEESRQAVLNGTFKTDLLQAVDLAGDGRKAERLRYDDRHQYVICT